MNRQLARLFGQAEVHLSEMGKRALGSVTTPLRIMSQEIAQETMEATSRFLRAAMIKAALGLVAAVMAIVALVYAVAALYEWLLPMLGPVEARLVIAGLFLAIAIVAIVAMIATPSGKPDIKAIADRASADAMRAAQESRDAMMAEARAAEADLRAGVAGTKAEAAATAQNASADLRAGFDTILSVLGDAGFRREQAGLRAGLALASQLKPMQIVSLAVIGGFLAGMRFPARRRHR